MFRTYLLPVQAAVALFPAIALLIMVPAAVHGYRRRGRAGGWPVLVFYSFVFYLLAALSQTVMPLPARTAAHCSTARYAESPQLQLLDFHTRIATASGGDWSAGTLAGLTVTWTTLLNLALLFPLGVYLRYYLRRGLPTSIALAFATTLFFETTQYTGLWFVYACPYRQFNVDDLALNTSGAILGWFVAGPLARVLPANDPDRERVRHGDRVTLTRRLSAVVTDLVGWLISWVVVTGLLAVATDAATGRRHAFAVGSALGLVWFWLLPAVLAASPGQRAVLLRVVRTDGRPAGFARATVRAWVAYAPLASIWLCAAQYTRDALLPAPVAGSLPYVTAAAVVVFWGTPLANASIGRGKPAPHERWSGTATVAVPPPLPQAGRGDPPRLAGRDRQVAAGPSQSDAAAGSGDLPTPDGPARSAGGRPRGGEGDRDAETPPGPEAGAFGRR
ncbi:VanZ family protein [Streptomyces sp. ZYX-F-203]